MTRRAADLGGGHEQVLELLPFHVNGSLDAVETARVEQHLRICAACREALAEERAFAAQFAAARSAVPDPAPGLDRLLQRIDAEAPGIATTLHADMPATYARTRDVPRPVPLAAAAAIVVAVTLGLLTATRQLRVPAPPAYRTLASEQASRPALPGSLIVVFDPALTRADIAQLLDGLPVTQLEARAQPGAYQLQLQHGAATRTTLDAVAARLRAQAGILFAGPASRSAVEPQR